MCVCVGGGVEYKGGVFQIYLTFFYTFVQVSFGAELLPIALMDLRVGNG